MQAALTRFVRALRMADVRISTSETLDAFQAVRLVGWADRELLRSALAAVLAKSTREAAVFDDCFERFFQFDDFSSNESARDDDDERRADGHALLRGQSMPGEEQQNGQPGGENSGGGGGESAGRPDDAGDAAPSTPTDHSIRTSDLAAPDSPLGRLLMTDDGAALSVAIAHASRIHGLEDIKVFTQQGLYTRRIMDTMGRPALMDEIAALDVAEASGRRRLGAELRRRHDRLRRQIRDYVEGQFLIHADARGERLRMQMLHRARIDNIPRHNEHLMRRMIQRMARKLVAAHSRRRRVARRGTLDVPRMIRRNMRFDATMVELAWKSRRIDRPRVFVICDVSGSVASYARFMLMFLYSLGEVLSQVRAFVFCSELAEVTALFQNHDLTEASRLTLAQYGGGSTDYGQAFADFEHLALDALDRRSTVLILGDARNNDGEARIDLLRKIHDRCQRLIWLNPEPRSAWGSGDSEMDRYAAHCHQVSACGSLAQLERVVSDLLRQVR